MTARLETDFPEPDSPTIASVSPRSTWKFKSTFAQTSPSIVGKVTLSAFTSNNLLMRYESADQEARMPNQR